MATSRRFVIAACSIAVLFAPACGEPPNTVRTYSVAYTTDRDSVSTTQYVRLDSVKYLDAAGVTQKVLNPGDNWSVVMSKTTGQDVEAHAWGSATSGGVAAKLRVTWTIPAVSTAGDSSSVATTAPGPFALSIERQTLP